MVLKIYETIHTKISFNTREGVRWFFVYCFGIWYIKRSFNTRVGVRWFEKVGKEQDHDDEFQYPCGCEVVLYIDKKGTSMKKNIIVSIPVWV